jgi:adenylate cyclase
VELNPHDPTILIVWGYTQACLGHAEAGLITLESALPFMLSPPDWYFHYRARVLALARRPAESAAQFAALSRLEGPRNLGWQAVALAHDQQVHKARLAGQQFIEQTRRAWRGDPAAGPSEFVSWFLGMTPVARTDDREYLRNGLKVAGLCE